MSLTQEKIKTLKKLTALSGDGNLNIDSVVDSFTVLQDKTIESLHTSTRSGQGSLMPREDRVISSQIPSLDLLHCSPQKFIAQQISLSSIMHTDE